MITDKLGSYGAARRKIMPKVEHRQHKGLNNRAENSHVTPTSPTERDICDFRGV
jgi:putative transposase